MTRSERERYAPCQQGERRRPIIIKIQNTMLISEILKTGTNVQLVVNALDLRELFLEWQAEAQAAAKQAAQQQKEETYLTAKECAERLSVDLSTLWRWDKTGYLPKVKMGKKIFYRLSDIQKLMEG